MRVDMYTDGASKGNPGPGGYGVVIVDRDTKEMISKYSDGYKNVTNNQMELWGVLRGLRELESGVDVVVYSDSQYVVDAFNKGWISNWVRRGMKNAKGETVKNALLWLDVLEAAMGKKIRFQWVKGHAGNKYNEMCDDLATTEASKIGVFNYYLEES